MKRKIFRVFSNLLIILLLAVSIPITVATAASTESIPTATIENSSVSSNIDEESVEISNICERISDSAKLVEEFFGTYDFAKEVLIAILGVIFASVSTVIINSGAMRKQCKFDMQYKILNEEAERVAQLHKKIESVEIMLSFGTRETAPLKMQIEEAMSLLLALEESLSSKRKFVRKYISATAVEKAAQYALDYKVILYKQGEAGFFDIQLRKEIDINGIANLRDLTQKLNKLHEEIVDGMEKIIAPGILASLGRKFRKPWMFLEKMCAYGKISKKK